MVDQVIIAEYNPAWPEQFAEERTRLLDLIGEYVEEIQHVGSTAVPGLAAKPVIDIMIAIRNLSLVPQTVAPIESLGYEYLGEFGLPQRHYFRKPVLTATSKRTHQIHMVLKGSNQWENQTRFRDYLRTHPETRQEYEQLKRELAERFTDNREAYTDSKQNFIFSVLRKAGYWDVRDTQGES